MDKILMQLVLRLLFIVLMFNVFSCSLFNDYSWEGIEEVKTIHDAMNYVKENIVYKKEYQEFWQFPQETNSLKTGDCEDMSALLAHLFIYNVKLSDVLLVGCIRKVDQQSHMVVRYGDRIFEATVARELFNFYDEFYIINSMSLQNYIDIARFYHL